MSKGFLDIQRIKFPRKCAQTAIDALFTAGRRGVEGVALFAGTRDGDVFNITRTIIPEQSAGNVESGLLYVVQGNELHRIGLELFDAGLQLIAQIHSHPGAAYHSETDDAYPIVTVLGGISIVVPNFARGGVNLREWAVYQLSIDNTWVELSNEQKHNLIHIIGDEAPPASKPFKLWPWH